MDYYFYFEWTILLFLLGYIDYPHNLDSSNDLNYCAWNNLFILYNNNICVRTSDSKVKGSDSQFGGFLSENYLLINSRLIQVLPLIQKIDSKVE